MTAIPIEELGAWVEQIAAELNSLQARASEASVPTGEAEPEVEAALGRAYLAVRESAAEMEARARADAEEILAAARAEAAALVDTARREAQAAIDEAMTALDEVFGAVREADAG